MVGCRGIPNPVQCRVCKGHSLAAVPGFSRSWQPYSVTTLTPDPSGLKNTCVPGRWLLYRCFRDFNSKTKDQMLKTLPNLSFAKKTFLCKYWLAEDQLDLCCELWLKTKFHLFNEINLYKEGETQSGENNFGQSKFHLFPFIESQKYPSPSLNNSF